MKKLPLGARKVLLALYSLSEGRVGERHTVEAITAEVNRLGLGPLDEEGFERMRAEIVDGVQAERQQLH